jgi:hypothetical protein
MVNNMYDALPQCSISNADIIYEVLAEGGITRMMAIFSDIRSAEHLGSIRSIRPYYIDISLGYGAVTVHAGGSEAAYSRIYFEKFDDIDGVRGQYSFPVFYRDQARRSAGYLVEHTLFTEGQNLYDLSVEKGFELTLPEDYDNGLHFVKDATPEDGQSAEEVKITFNIGKYTDLHYHEDTGMYTAYQYQHDYVDGNTDELVEFRNVIIFEAVGRVLDEYGRRSFNLFDEGNGFYLCGGKMEPITWKRANLEDCFHYYRADGSELTVSQGKTYIAIMDKGTSTVEFT